MIQKGIKHIIIGFYIKYCKMIENKHEILDTTFGY